MYLLPKELENEVHEFIATGARGDEALAAFNAKAALLLRELSTAVRNTPRENMVIFF